MTDKTITNRVNLGLFINLVIKVLDYRVKSLQWRIYDNFDVYGSINNVDPVLLYTRLLLLELSLIDLLFIQYIIKW